MYQNIDGQGVFVPKQKNGPASEVWPPEIPTPGKAITKSLVVINSHVDIPADVLW